MTDDLTDLEALAQAASQGAWKAEPLPNGGHTVFIPDTDEGVTEDRYLTRANAAFIAAARDAVPALIARVRKAEAERDNWRDKAQEAGAAYGLANSKHHEELHRANRLERLADTLAGKAVNVEDRARTAEQERDEARAALALAVEAVKSRREAFLSSPDLDPAWVAGWHAASDDALHSIRAALAGGDA